MGATTTKPYRADEFVLGMALLFFGLVRGLVPWNVARVFVRWIRARWLWRRA